MPWKQYNTIATNYHAWCVKRCSVYLETHTLTCRISMLGGFDEFSQMAFLKSMLSRKQSKIKLFLFSES